jgi:hypothetical protein
MTVNLCRDAWGRLVLSLPERGQPIVVEPVRCFPLTQPAEHLSLVDGHGREVLRIGSLDELPTESRRVLEETLAEREFSPVLQRIDAISSPSPPCWWDVETDRGRTRFHLDSEDDIRRLPDGTVILADANGIRYRILDEKQLDAGSRAILRRFL